MSAARIRSVTFKPAALNGRGLSGLIRYKEFVERQAGGQMDLRWSIAHRAFQLIRRPAS